MEEVEVFFDGQCGFCQAMAQKIGTLDRFHRLLWRDYNEPAVARSAEPRFTPADLAREMHVRLPDGTWRIGFAAWAAILKVLPRTSLIGRLMLFPPSAEIGRAFYRWFAPRRREISKLLGLPASCGPEGSCRIHALTPHPPHPSAEGEQDEVSVRKR